MSHVSSSPARRYFFQQPIFKRHLGQRFFQLCRFAAKAFQHYAYFLFGKNEALNLGYLYFEDDYDNLPTYAWDMKEQGPVTGYT